MFYEKELKFLTDTLKKCHIRTALISPDEPMSSLIGEDVVPILSLSIKRSIK